MKTDLMMITEIVDGEHAGRFVAKIPKIGTASVCGTADMAYDEGVRLVREHRKNKGVASRSLKTEIDKLDVQRLELMDKYLAAVKAEEEGLPIYGAIPEFGEMRSGVRVLDNNTPIEEYFKRRVVSVVMRKNKRVRAASPNPFVWFWSLGAPYEDIEDLGE